MLPLAVTFDFHDTLAICDRWFEVEVRTLVPNLLHWHDREAGTSHAARADEAAAHYRSLRREVIVSGRERDALGCARHVLQALDIAIDDDMVVRGLEAVMLETLDDTEPVPGAVCTVRALADAGVRLGVVSSAVYHPFLEWTLERFGVLDAFTAIVTSASAGFYKSDPQIYLHAARQLGIPPRNCVHIGDSFEYDVIGAQRAGMRAVWLRRGATLENGAAPDLIVDTLEDLDAVLLGLF